MSVDSSEQAPIAPHISPESHTELDISQKHREILSLATNLGQSSAVSTEEAVGKMDKLNQRLSYALADDEDVLIVNPYGTDSNPEAVITEEAIRYQQTIDAISAHGYLPPIAREAYLRSFSVIPRELGNTHAILEGDFLADPIRMSLVDADAEEALLKVGEELALDAEAIAELKRIAEEKQHVANNPNVGSNFLYHYSAPFIELGTKDGEVQARLGLVQTHRDSEGSEPDIVTFRGVSVPVEPAFNMISDGIEPYALQAGAEKAVVTDAPPVEDLKQEILGTREATLVSFVEQLKKMAPEASSVPDERLIQLVRDAAENHYGIVGKGYPDLPPVEAHVLRVIMSRNAEFGGVAKKDDKNMPARGKEETPMWYDPQSFLYANGRTGLVTRVEYSGSPLSFAASAKEISREVFNPDESARLRQEMFLATTGQASAVSPQSS